MDPLYMFVCVCVHSYVYMYTLCFQRECLEKYMDTAFLDRVDRVCLVKTQTQHSRYQHLEKYIYMKTLLKKYIDNTFLLIV